VLFLKWIDIYIDSPDKTKFRAIGRRKAAGLRS
jgi:hypothetical protein